MDISVDTYISPRDLKLGGAPTTEQVALMVQHFAANIVRPHMSHFLKHCKASGVTPPAPRGMN